MKVSFKISRFLFWLTIVSFIPYLGIYLLYVNGTVLPFVSYICEILNFAITISDMIYLFSILKFAKEKKAIIVALIVNFTYHLMITLGEYLFSGIITPVNELFLFYVLVIILRIYLLVNLFRIAHPAIALPYKIFGVTLLTVLLLKMTSIYIPNATPIKLQEVFYFIDYLPTVAVLFILYRVMIFLKR